MKLCLIGSTRFMERYVEANKTLTLMGNIVYTVATISTQLVNRMDESPGPTEDEKMVLDLVHLRKIAESDVAVLITDETGYYGFSTKREMIWTGMLGKDIVIYIPAGKDRPANLYQPSPFGGKRIMDVPTSKQLAKLIDEVVNPKPNPQESAILGSGRIRDIGNGQPHTRVMTPGGEE